MRLIFQKRSYYLLAVLAIIFVAALLISGSNANKSEVISATVERGEVNETIAVSGFVEAKNTAELAFPTTGVVTEVFVDEGTEVKAGEVLATLASGKLVADRSEALAALRSAQAQLDETLAGPTATEQAVTETTVNNAASSLAQVETEQAEKVANAKATLLSNGLEARTIDPRETATAPTISGTYLCDEEGTYNLSVYDSGAASGYSYRLSGLETDTTAAYTDQPAPLGSCGLYIQFDATSSYNNSKWIIEIPNTRSASYVTYQNAYELALKQQENAIKTAKDSLDLVNEQATEANAPARSEVVTQRQAVVTQARARVAQIDALLSDRSIVAAFDGTVTNVDIVPGETANSSPVITVLANDAFELTARIPEIDIRKIKNGQKVLIEFDAASDEMLAGEVTYISPLATEIDGVAYFEATITLENIPDWMRSGLNADIDIIVGKVTDNLRLPKRFVTTENGKYFVLLGEEKKEINILFTGNDGYVAISGLKEGDEVIAP